MTIQRRELPVKFKRTFKDQVFFWKGMPVAITPQLAEFYECSERQLTQNFNNNKERFKIGKHFFRLTGKQIIDFARKANLSLFGNEAVLMLWTKRGAVRHARMLRTDKAWDVWERLEEDYFEKNEKSDWERVGDLVTPHLLFQQRSIAHQKANSNAINAENVYSEEQPAIGRAKAMAYNQRNCLTLTERLPSSWREQGRGLGLPRRITCSAKAVARVVQPELACVRSMADQMVMDGIAEDVAFDVASSCTTTFRLLAESGWRPRSFMQQ